MHLLAMIVIMFCHDVVNHFIKGRFHHIIRLAGYLTGFFRIVKMWKFLE